MSRFLQIRNVTVNHYIEEINNSIQSKNYLSALAISLMIPDMCSKKLGLEKKFGYVTWFNKYVFRKYYDYPKKQQLKKLKKGIGEIYKIKINGNVCYALRCAILHSGSSYIDFEKRKR